jgi:hypothetical protein
VFACLGGVLMKKKTKIIIVVLIVLVLLIPIPTRYKDGGSVRYRAVLYDVTKYHQIDLDSKTGFREGWEIKVLGISILDTFD